MRSPSKTLLCWGVLPKLCHTWTWYVFQWLDLTLPHSVVSIFHSATLRSLTKGLRTPCDCWDGQGLGPDINYMHRYMYLSPPFMPIWSRVHVPVTSIYAHLVTCPNFMSDAFYSTDCQQALLPSSEVISKTPLLSPSTQINILLIRKVALRTTLLTISQAEVNKHLCNRDKMACTLN